LWKLFGLQLKKLKIINNLKTLKVVTTLFVSIIGYYFFEFYLIENNANLHFWCIQISNNFNFGPFAGVSLPIHCDEGPYRLSSQSLEQFFSKNNPYQTRPLYVFLIYVLSNLIDFFIFFEISEYQNFRFSMIVLQILIMISIISLFVSLLKLEFKSFKDFFIIVLLIGIPGIRWNIFFPSAGNLTLLFFLIVLNLITNKQKFQSGKKYTYLLLGVLSLAHLSSIIYGLIIELVDFARTKKVNLLNRILDLGILIFFPLIYRFIIYISPYEFYDWHTGVYSQFSWIIFELQNGTFFTFETLNTHIITYLKITYNYIGYFFILLSYFFLLMLLLKYKKKEIPIKVKYAFLINLIIFIFWGLQGLYESFRFTNYSIGYFLFITIFILLVESFEKDMYLISAILFYILSIGYIEPYNESLNYPQLNFLTYLSVTLFFVFIFKEIKLKKEILKYDS
tara:strand:- start:817 stop:2169 length:1353 start_codon:yes stop_codon:yes gene_type:complete